MSHSIAPELVDQLVVDARVLNSNLIPDSPVNFDALDRSAGNIAQAIGFMRPRVWELYADIFRDNLVTLLSNQKEPSTGSAREVSIVRRTRSLEAREERRMNENVGRESEAQRVHRRTVMYFAREHAARLVDALQHQDAVAMRAMLGFLPIRDDVVNAVNDAFSSIPQEE